MTNHTPTPWKIGVTGRMNEQTGEEEWSLLGINDHPDGVYSGSHFTIGYMLSGEDAEHIIACVNGAEDKYQQLVKHLEKLGLSIEPAWNGEAFVDMPLPSSADRAHNEWEDGLFPPFRAVDPNGGNTITEPHQQAEFFTTYELAYAVAHAYLLANPDVSDVEVVNAYSNTCGTIDRMDLEEEQPE